MLANYAGQAWMALIGLAAVPLYVRFLGVEAYGVIGIFATLQAVFALLDLGMGHTANRELARLAALEGATQEMRDLMRTLEIPYWLLGLLVGGAVAALSPVIAHRWVNAEALSPDTVQHAVLLMGVTMGLRWPCGLYGGALMGLQKQVLFNAVSMALETARAIGAVLVLWLVSATLEAFFLWQTFFALAGTLVLVACAWTGLPPCASRARFRRDVLARVWRFAAGITGISLLSTILMQLDKVILSRLLPLEAFGFYMLATVVALTLYRFFGPIFSAVYPRFTALLAKGASAELTRLYHQSAQLLSLAVLPAAMIVAVFSQELMLLWTQDAVIATRTHVLVTILTLGTALNGLMHIPYGLQLAAGWTRLAFLLNLWAVLLLAPLLVLLTSVYGVVGAASVWLILNAAYILVGVQLMHRRLLPGEQRHWYAVDAGAPLFASLLAAGAMRATMPSLDSLPALAVYIAASAAVTLGVTAFAMPFTRSAVLGRLSMLFSVSNAPRS